MPFVPHTQVDVDAMLESIGVGSIAMLFDEIPTDLLSGELSLPPALNEMQVTRLMQDRAESDGRWLNFIGAGAYEHHIPAAVWQIVTRGEFYSAYTPYQAEASQGTLQLLYEWQTMMASLTGLDVSNASLYDGASALAETILMAVRASKAGHRRVLMPQTVHPLYRRAAQTIVRNQGIEIVELPYCSERGNTVPAALEAHYKDGIAAVVIPQPNFFGVLEDVHELTQRAHALGALAIGLCNPLSLAVLEAPGRWGEKGADIACGEAQPLGIPLSCGGPYLGYLTCKSVLVRQMPGRIVGRTLDIEGKCGYTLTLQAREQHIRRSKATSNICTNQGLMVTASTIYLALTGLHGLERIAAHCHDMTRTLKERLRTIGGVAPLFDAPYFNEVALRLPKPIRRVLDALRRQGILGGYDLERDYPELGNALLVCATETKTDGDIDRFASALRAATAD